MTPMQYELHEARKERLQRMKAWQTRNVVSLIGIRQPHEAAPLPAPEPIEKPKEAPKSPGVTPIHEIRSPVIREGAEPQISHIRQVVAKRYRISLDEIKSDSRNQFVMLPRQIAYTLARRLTSKSLPAIGRAFGGRDHTTVLHGVRKMERRARTDETFATELEQLAQLIMGRTDLPCPCCGSVSEASND